MAEHIYMECRQCGASLKKIKYGRALRKHGRCYSCIGPHWICGARTVKGGACPNIAIEFGGRCKIHKRIEERDAKQARERETVKSIKESPDSYRAYLESSAWKIRRQMILDFWGNRCALCYKNNRVLHVHHRTYKRVRHENLTDLIPLCKPCHEKFHEKEFGE